MIDSYIFKIHRIFPFKLRSEVHPLDFTCFASFPRLILIGAKWLKKCGPGLHNEDFGEHVLLTGGDAEHHPSYNIQPPTSISFFFCGFVLSLVPVFPPHCSIGCWSPNWGRPPKTYATVFYEEVLYLLFLEYR